MVAYNGVVRVNNQSTNDRWVLAPSLVALLGAINARWPDRDRSSDGSVGDQAHAVRDSDHNPRKLPAPIGWYVGAVDIDADLDNDPASPNAPETAQLISAAIAHPATAYVIYDGIIWNRTRSFRPAQYTGPNPHKGHVHVSILRSVDAILNTAAWFPNTPEVDDVPYTPDQLKALVTEAVVDAVPNVPIKNKWGQVHRLGDILAAMDYNIVQAPEETAAAFLRHKVTVMDPATGKDSEVTAEQALTRASEATVTRQALQVDSADDKAVVGTDTAAFEALMAEFDAKTGRMTARQRKPGDPPAK